MIAVALDGKGLRLGQSRILQPFNLQITAGECVAIIGPSGAGKTSLLRAVAGFIRPDAGAVVFHGADGEIEAEAARRAALHLLGHHEGLKPQRTARQELGFQVEWLGGSAAAMDAAVERLKLTPLLDLETRKLSAGQRRRLSLARLVAAPRALWLLDEPLAPLDEAWRGVAAELMAEHLASGGMILAAVHDPLPLPARALDLGGLG